MVVNVVFHCPLPNALDFIGAMIVFGAFSCAKFVFGVLNYTVWATTLADWLSRVRLWSRPFSYFFRNVAWNIAMLFRGPSLLKVFFYLKFSIGKFDVAVFVVVAVLAVFVIHFSRPLQSLFHYYYYWLKLVCFSLIFRLQNDSCFTQRFSFSGMMVCISIPYHTYRVENASHVQTNNKCCTVLSIASLSHIISLLVLVAGFAVTAVKVCFVPRFSKCFDNYNYF